MTAELKIRGAKEVSDMFADLALSVDEDIANVGRTIAWEILTELVRATPRASGNAAANWQVTINAPATSVVPLTTNPLDGLRTIAGAKAGETIYIQNRVPYIWRLNEGYSPQAGAGWIERAIDLGIYAGQRVRIVGG